MKTALNTKNSGKSKGEVISKEQKAIIQELKVETPTLTLMERVKLTEDQIAKAKSDISFANTEVEIANSAENEWDKERQVKAQTQLETANANYQIVIETRDALTTELEELTKDVTLGTKAEVKEEVKEEVKAEVVADKTGLEGQSSTVDGMTAEDMRLANEKMDADEKARQDLANSKLNTDSKAIEDQKIIDDAKAVADAKAIEDQKIIDDKIKNIVEPKTSKKVLIPKAWQVVSEDGNKLINMITFLGEKKEYEVGMKHKYRFGNLSISDGMTRIITAKFPKEDVSPVKESIMYKGYQLDIDKFGNSAVCLLKDPDAIVMLEFVSLATVIDVLQDELNPNKECDITWGTIDQVIKHKRGLKSRIKNLTDEDAPKRVRETKDVVVAEVAADKPLDKPVEEEIIINKEKELVAQ